MRRPNEADNVPEDWQRWWLCSGSTGEWTFHERKPRHEPMRPIKVARLTAAELDHAEAVMRAWDEAQLAKVTESEAA